MKKRTIHVFPILLVFLLLLVGCRDSGQEPRAEWDREAGILTVDGVRYRKDEALVSIGDGLQRWRYEQSAAEQIASAGERGGQETYLVFANGTERRLLYGRGDGFSFGPLSYEVWFREDLLDELSGPLTEERSPAGPSRTRSSPSCWRCMRVRSGRAPSPMRTPRRRPRRLNWKATDCGAGWNCPTGRSRG